MRTCRGPSLLCVLILLVISDSTEGMFFQFPRRALMNFLESLGGHKQAKPIHHYHMHYYPVPVILPKPAPPPKIEIDLSALHHGVHDQYRSLSWPDQDFNKIHDTEVLIPSAHPDSSWTPPLPEAWPDSGPPRHKSWNNAWDNNELLEKDHTFKEAKPPGILLQVPLRQQIVFYQPPAKDTKSSLLSIFFKKLRRLNDALFHPEEESHEHHHDNAPHISNSLTYAPTS